MHTPTLSSLQAAKALVWQWLHATRAAGFGDARQLGQWLADDAEWHCAHPVNVQTGLAGIHREWVAPLVSAFPDIERRCDIFMAGDFDGRFCGGAGTWVAVTGHYCGTFSAPLFGIAASHNLAFLRFGEFYRVDGGKIVEARVLVDLVDLLRQVGIRVLPVPTGIEMLVPGPSDHCGLLLDAQAAAVTFASMQRVEAMIGGLHQFKDGSLKSMGMQSHWSADMMWYGPAGIGSMRGVDGFQTHHQKPFLTAFPDRKGGNHRARIAEGAYVASTGWPSVRATHAGEYLGVPATGRAIEMRVMDWWRVADETLNENWVYIDLPHLMLQMGVDLLARAKTPG